MNKITRKQIIIIAEFFEKHPELINFIRSSSDFTSSQENALWEELAAALAKRFKIKSPKLVIKDWIKTWWDDYAYDLNRAYMNVLANPADTKLPVHYDVDLACRFLTVMGYDNVHRVLQDVKIPQSSNTEKNPQQLDEDLGTRITSYSISKTDSISDQTWEPSQAVVTPVLPQIITSVVLKSMPKAPNTCNSSRNTTSSVAKSRRYFRPIAPKILKSAPTPTPTVPETSENLPNIVPIQPETSESLLNFTTTTPETFENPSNIALIQPGTSKNLLNFTTTAPEKFENPSNTVLIQPGTSDSVLNFNLTIPEISECPPHQENISKSPPNASPINQKQSKSPPNCSPIAPLSPESTPSNDSSISEKVQDGASSPNLSIEDALLAIAKEVELENSLAKQNMQLKQQLLRLNKRKITAVDLISKKLCLF